MVEIPSISHHTGEWERVDVARGDDRVNAYFALQTSVDPSHVESVLMTVSDPHSSRYGQWLSWEQSTSLLQPTGEALKALEDFVGQRPFHRVNNLVRLPLTVGDASRMFNTSMHVYRNNQHRIVRASSALRVPAALRPHLLFVSGLTHFPRLRKTVVRSKKNERIGFAVTPRLIHDRYGTGETRNKAANNSQAVAQFLGQHFWETDLQEFFTIYSISNLGKHPVKVGPDSGFAGVEASLDIEYIMSVGQDVHTYFWSTPGLHEGQEPFLDWMMALANDTRPPLVNSVSYGDDEPSLDVSYMKAVNTQFAALGARGVSILFASGDSGVGGDSGCGPKGQFVPSFPAGSPWVTAVGGTTCQNPFESGPEVAWSGSGGGFSNQWAIPSYQSSAVATYLRTAKHLPPQHLWNRTGRAYPDVAAFSTGFMVVTDLLPSPVDGTSCATPTFSGVVSLVNGARLSQGKPPLGFLNPFLYSVAGPAKATTDILVGYNPNCNSNGFECTPGWDPVTGWGSPIYPKLVQSSLSVFKKQQH